jgi:hypothetical protein
MCEQMQSCRSAATGINSNVSYTQIRHNRMSAEILTLDLYWCDFIALIS